MEREINHRSLKISIELADSLTGGEISKDEKKI